MVPEETVVLGVPAGYLQLRRVLKPSKDKMVRAVMVELVAPEAAVVLAQPGDKLP